MTEEQTSAFGALRTSIGESDLRIVLVTLGFVYVLFAMLVVLEEGLALQTVNSIFGAWRTITFLSAAYAILALALNLHWGYTGMFNIGVAGFMAIGVYTMALLSTPTDALSGQGLGLPLPIGVAAGMIVAALAGLITAVPALRLRADYLAIVTLGFSEIVRLTLNSRSFSDWLLATFGFATGGGSGLDMPERPTNALLESGIGDTIIDVFTIQSGGDEVQLVSNSIIEDFAWVLVMTVFMLGIYWLLLRIGYSPFGRVLKAIREDELVAQSLGKDTRWFKIKVFMLGCALMGLGGMLWQGSQGYTSPNSFLPVVTFYVFIALIIGGSGSNTGSVVGAILFSALLFEAPSQIGAVLQARLDLGSAPGTFYGALEPLLELEFAPLLAYVTSNLGPVQFILLGVVLVVIVHHRPQGMLGDRTETAAATDLTVRPSRGGDSDE